MNSIADDCRRRKAATVSHGPIFKRAKLGTSMYETLVAIHDEMLQRVAQAKDQLRELKLTTFFPMKGSDADGELMVIGRAVNGWACSWTAQDAAVAERRAEILREVVNMSTRDGNCPMKWVGDSWGRSRNQGYNTRTSAFWRTIRRIANTLFRDTEDWWSKLIWSDLYKNCTVRRWKP